jgi:hypothetical protein
MSKYKIRLKRQRRRERARSREATAAQAPAPKNINAVAILGALNHRFEKLLEPKSSREVLASALASKK